MADEGFFNLLPDTNIVDEKIKQRSKTYKFNMESKSIKGKIDDKESVIQAIMLRLMTDAKVYQIFSDTYGLAVNDIIGLPRIIVSAEIERRIKETLLQDDRINSICDFSLTPDEDVAIVKFTVNTIYGITTVERGYSI
ncbi:MAG: DUF2634 domain-containing protein [Clostridiales bacterium]